MKSAAPLSRQSALLSSLVPGRYPARTAPAQLLVDIGRTSWGICAEASLELSLVRSRNNSACSCCYRCCCLGSFPLHISVNEVCADGARSITEVWKCMIRWSAYKSIKFEEVTSHRTKSCGYKPAVCKIAVGDWLTSYCSGTYR